MEERHEITQSGPATCRAAALEQCCEKL